MQKLINTANWVNAMATYGVLEVIAPHTFFNFTSRKIHFKKRVPGTYWEGDSLRLTCPGR
jgi:hypothetical protein